MGRCEVVWSGDRQDIGFLVKDRAPESSHVDLFLSHMCTPDHLLLDKIREVDGVSAKRFLEKSGDSSNIVVVASNG
jgi:hypothetical protein